MKIEYKVTYTEEEIKNMITILKFLCEFDEDDKTALTRKIVDRVDKAFLNLSELLCLDPEGVKAFEREGW